ncbi:MAG: hypothetical protein VR67_11920 [Peptococcaceae bacterium BRH_c8a]|nr:MAG: hypothetical protein VR67_11920 [Peptococcaceae bacterium BRH_c8a]
MGQESSGRPGPQILAVVTLDKERVLGGNQLTLLAQNEEEQKNMTLDLAKAIKAEVMQMKSGDYVLFRG